MGMVQWTQDVSSVSGICQVRIWCLTFHSRSVEHHFVRPVLCGRYHHHKESQLWGKSGHLWTQASLSGMIQWTQYFPSVSRICQVKILYDASLFICEVSNKILYALIYVDDIIITGNHNSEVNQGITSHAGHFFIKDLPYLHVFLGIEVVRIAKGITLSHSN